MVENLFSIGNLEQPKGMDLRTIPRDMVKSCPILLTFGAVGEIVGEIVAPGRGFNYRHNR